MTRRIHRLREAYERLTPTSRNRVAPLVRALPVRVRYGSAFAVRRALLRSAGEATREQIGAFEAEAFRVIGSAASRSVFWSRRFAEAGVDAERFSVADLVRLPLLDKNTIREEAGAMLDPAVAPADRKWVTTGGTSGQSIGLWIEKDASAIDWAHVVDAWSRVGFQLDEKRVVLRGRRLGTGETRALFEYEPLRRELYVSVFDMDSAHLPAIREEIGRFGARFVHGYPSALEVLGKSYVEAGEAPPPLEALLAVSENVYPGQREALEAFFGCRLFSFYGLSEKVAFAAECEHSTELHVDPYYGYVELVDEAGLRVDEPHVRGEIVATAFVSHAMPIIRYRTGDYAEWASGSCECGRRYRRFKRIEGRRASEHLVTHDGAKISMTAINVHSSIFDAVRRFRFVQERPGEARLLVEAGDRFDEATRQAIFDELNGKIGGQVDLTVEVVDRLPLTEIGKHRFIDQRVGPDETVPR